MTLDNNQIRAQFPSLDRPAIFFDNPGGTQIARQSAGAHPIAICWKRTPTTTVRSPPAGSPTPSWTKRMPPWPIF